MRNTRFVTSLELSRKLKEAEVIQESEWFWDKFTNTDNTLFWELEDKFSTDFFEIPVEERISAYTAGELAELLPYKIKNESVLYCESEFFLTIFKTENVWEVYYNNLAEESILQAFSTSLTEAMGLMLLKLKEEEEI